MKLCLSIAPSSMAEAISEIKSANKIAQIVEMRIDSISELNIPKLLQLPRPKVIITNRKTSEGGSFSGSSKEIYSIITSAFSNDAEFVDVEFSWGEKLIQKLITNKQKCKVILSYHNFDKTPKNIDSIYKKMRRSGADILKIVTMANDITDNLLIFKLLEIANKQGDKLIAFCMGEHGQISRILSGIYGCFLTYGAKNENLLTAPGQVSFNNLKYIFRADKLNKHSKVFGLVGNPVTNSRGIYFHNKIFAQKGLPAVYINFLINDVKKFLQSFYHLYSGLSISMPFKKTVVSCVDKLEGCAQDLQVVNTILKKNGKLIGYNTDMPATIELLKRHTPIKNKNVIVLGTGATSKTFAYAAISNGAHVTIVGRSRYKTQKLSSELNCSFALFKDLKEHTADIIMNGTSIGMNPNDDFPYLPDKLFKPRTIVFDAVYGKNITPMILLAKEKGCKVITGKELFIKQAKLQSKIFLSLLQ